MNQLQITVDHDRTVFMPGAIVTGKAIWELEQSPEKMEIKLLWYTRGKGTQDLGVVDLHTFPNPIAKQQHDFQLRLPDSPYSFSGKLISIVWAIELIAYPLQDAALFEITMSPSGKEIVAVS